MLDLVFLTLRSAQSYLQYLAMLHYTLLPLSLPLPPPLQSVHDLNTLHYVAA